MMPAKKNILIALLLVLVAGAIYVYKEFNRTNADITREQPAFTVTATDLIKAFTDNDSIAARKYVGKIISITGLVMNLNKDEKGYSVSLGDTASMSSVRCSIDSMYTQRAANLKPGMSLQVKGNCTGFNEDELLGLDVIINRCVIE